MQLDKTQILSKPLSADYPSITRLLYKNPHFQPEMNCKLKFFHTVENT